MAWKQTGKHADTQPRSKKEAKAQLRRLDFQIAKQKKQTELQEELVATRAARGRASTAGIDLREREHSMRGEK